MLLICARTDELAKTDQSVDFMLLRAATDSDPDLVVLRGGGSTRGSAIPEEWALTYRNSGPGWAYAAEVSAVHPSAEVKVSLGEVDLPPPAQENPRYEQRARTGLVKALRQPTPGDGSPVLLVVKYRDIRGVVWGSSVELVPNLGDYQMGLRRRRIVQFPSQSDFAGSGAGF